MRVGHFNPRQCRLQFEMFLGRPMYVSFYFTSYIVLACFRSPPRQRDFRRDVKTSVHVDAESICRRHSNQRFPNSELAFWFAPTATNLLCHPPAFYRTTSRAGNTDADGNIQPPSFVSSRRDALRDHEIDVPSRADTKTTSSND